MKNYAIISCSVTKEQKKFIDETTFKPSKILQQAINALMEDYHKTDLKGLLDIQKKRTAGISQTLNKMRDFIEQKGLMDDFFNNDEKKRENPSF